MRVRVQAIDVEHPTQVILGRDHQPVRVPAGPSRLTLEAVGEVDVASLALDRAEGSTFVLAPLRDSIPFYVDEDHLALLAEVAEDCVRPHEPPWFQGNAVPLMKAALPHLVSEIYRLKDELRAAERARDDYRKRLDVPPMTRLREAAAALHMEVVKHDATPNLTLRPWEEDPYDD